MRKILFTGFLILGFLIMGNQAQASTTSDILNIVNNLKKDISYFGIHLGALAYVSPYSTGNGLVGGTTLNNINSSIDPNTLTKVTGLNDYYSTVGGSSTSSTTTTSGNVNTNTTTVANPYMDSSLKTGDIQQTSGSSGDPQKPPVTYTCGSNGGKTSGTCPTGQYCATLDTPAGTLYGCKDNTTTTTTPAKSTVGDITYGLKNNTGVEFLQNNLVNLGYTLTADGDFGSGTLKAINSFEKANNLTLSTKTSINSDTIDAISDTASTGKLVTAAKDESGSVIQKTISKSEMDYLIKTHENPVFKDCPTSSPGQNDCIFYAGGKRCVITPNDYGQNVKFCEQAITTPSTKSSLDTTTADSSGLLDTTTSKTASLSTGATGSIVKNVQSALNSLGFTVGTLDGKLGKNTKKAISTFQKNNDLTVTGTVDDTTYSAILSALEEKVSTSATDATKPQAQAVNPSGTCTSTTSPSITIISPNGGETYTAGQKIGVVWGSCNVPVTAKIRINVVDVTDNLATGIIDTNNQNGSQSILLPVAKYKDSVTPVFPGMTYGKNFKVSVSWLDSGSLAGVYDLSDNLLQIDSPSTPIKHISVLSPGKGYRYCLGPIQNGQAVNQLPFQVQINSEKVGEVDLDLVDNPSVTNTGNKYLIADSFGFNPMVNDMEVGSAGLITGYPPYKTGEYYLMATWKSNDKTENVTNFSGKFNIDEASVCR